MHNDVDLCGNLAIFFFNRELFLLQKQFAFSRRVTTRLLHGLLFNSWCKESRLERDLSFPTLANPG